MPKRDTLTADDLSVVDLVLGLHPDLEMVLMVGIHARSVKLKYPLKSHTDLKALFPAGKKRLTFRGHAVSYEQALKYLPKEFFPIATEEAFLRRVLIALQRETLSQRRKLPARSKKDVVFFDPAFAAGIPGAAER